jgi:recombinational DNA repair protein RecT
VVNAKSNLTIDLPPHNVCYATIVSFIGNRVKLDEDMKIAWNSANKLLVQPRGGDKFDNCKLMAETFFKELLKSDKQRNILSLTKSDFDMGLAAVYASDFLKKEPNKSFVYIVRGKDFVLSDLWNAFAAKL